MSDATPPRLVRTADVGGTHVTVGTVDTRTRRLTDPSTRVDIPRGVSADAVLDIVGDALLADGAPEHWSLAFPGPFEYDEGRAMIEGLDKLESLHEVDVRGGLAERAEGRPDIVFLNDAHAFGLGEWWGGAARGHDRVIAITLGTGFGSVFLDDGVRVATGEAVPPDGWMYPVAVDAPVGEILDEVVSTRGIQAFYGADPAPSVREIAERARDGEDDAVAAIHAAARVLCDALLPWVERFEASCVVVGGSIAKSLDLFRPELGPLEKAASVVVAEQLEDAPLLGAANFLLQQAEGRPRER